MRSPSKPLAATVTNDDVRQITITGVEVVGANAGDFSLDGSGCIGQTLAPGASCELSASFDPAAGGLREAQLEITLGDTGQTLSLALSGTGIAEPESKHQEPEPPPQEPAERSRADPKAPCAPLARARSNLGLRRGSGQPQREPPQRAVAATEWPGRGSRARGSQLAESAPARLGIVDDLLTAARSEAS